MNRAITAITITAIGAILLAWAPTTAYAGVDNSAQVILDSVSGCIVFDETLDAHPAERSHFVQNKKTAKVTCQASGIPNASGEDSTLVGSCGIFGKFGEYSVSLVNEIVDNGDGTANITLQCHAKATA